MANWLVPWDSIISNNNRQYNVGWKSSQRQLSQEAIDKLIYDVMSSDQGLAALSSGENLSGGSNSSVKTLMAQDMMTKLIGELATVTAKTVEEQDMVTDKESKQGRKLSVICTELKRQGLLSEYLYEKVGPPWKQVSYFTWRGYSFWATKIAKKMQTSPLLTAFFEPIVVSRYKYLSGDPDFHLLGRLTVALQPVCWVLGFIVANIQHFKDLKNGRTYNLSGT